MKVLSCFDHAFVLNLPHDVQRMKLTREELAKHDIPFERLEGETILDFPQSHHLANLGCLRSHLSAVRLARKRGYESVVIFEDDIALRPNFRVLWTDVTPQMKDLIYDLFYPYRWSIRSRLSRPIQVLQIGGTLCMHFYAIHSRFYEKYIRIAEAQINAGTNLIPLDRMFFSSEFTIYATSYNMAGQRAGPSHITSEMRNGTQFHYAFASLDDSVIGSRTPSASMQSITRKVELATRKRQSRSAAFDRLNPARLGEVRDLRNYFEQTWVISLKRRHDRLTRFWAELEKANWPFRRPEVFHAVDGNKVGVPKFWQTGAGSYGCFRSHMALLERAIVDDVKSILVLEDDALFSSNFTDEVVAFLGKVPSNWQCLMLGGEHVNGQPIPVTPGVVRPGSGGGIQRTHCYALRGIAVMKALYRVWANAAVHCDWVMGPCMAKFNTYAPEPFLVGQSDNNSDISGQNHPTRIWRSPRGNEPVILLRAPRAVMEELQKSGWHSGYNRDDSTGMDVGLRDLFSDKQLTHSDREGKLRDWIRTIQNEAASMADPGICTIWHPSIRLEHVRCLVAGEVLEIIASTSDEALSQLVKTTGKWSANRSKKTT